MVSTGHDFLHPLVRANNMKPDKQTDDLAATPEMRGSSILKTENKINESCHSQSDNNWIQLEHIFFSKLTTRGLRKIEKN